MPPSENMLKSRTKKQGDRHISPFYHSTHSMSLDAIFCIPCLLFTDAHSRGEKFRANQGNAFVVNGFSNWRKQRERFRAHETYDTHLNAKVALVLFQQGVNVEDLLDHQSKEN